MAVDPLTGYQPAKRERSRRTVDRILAAAERLMQDRPFTEVSVNELCIEAGCSSSSFYDRFGTKDAVLVTLFERHRVVVEDRLDRALATAADGTADIDTLTRTIVAEFAVFVGEHAPVMRSIYALPDLRGSYWQLAVKVGRALGEVVESTYDCSDELSKRRVDFSIRVASTALQRAMGVPSRYLDGMGLDDDLLADELATMLLAYWETTLRR